MTERHPMMMTKAEITQNLRNLLEAANLCDAEGSDCPQGWASSQSLYGAISAALVIVDEPGASDAWSESGEWPALDVPAAPAKPKTRAVRRAERRAAKAAAAA